MPTNYISLICYMNLLFYNSLKAVGSNIKDLLNI